MMAKLIFALALSGLLLAPTWDSSATVRAGGNDPQTMVQNYLSAPPFNVQVGRYRITPVTDDYVANTFPDVSFFEVTFIQYPVARPIPQGLNVSNIFLVQNGVVDYLLGPPNDDQTDLTNFFLDNLEPVTNDDEAQDAARTWVRLSSVFMQDGFYTFSDPEFVFDNIDGDGNVTAGASIETTMGFRQGTDPGEIDVELDFDSNGVLQNIFETNRTEPTPGPRPICQATKLLDADPIVRKMAEQDILVMGKACRGYLDDQRAKARPELQLAIDRMWNRILQEKAPEGIRPIGQASKLLDADELVRRIAEQDILVMGKACKSYLDEEQARANPELQMAIDRIWQRILNAKK
jgi:hypothetical protein